MKDTVWRPASPGTPRQRGQLSHGVSPRHGQLLQLQRQAGNQAVVQLAKARPVTADELGATGARLAKAAHDLVGTPAAANLFDVITAQVSRSKPRSQAPRHKADDPLDPVYAELYSAETVAVLARLSAGQRTTLLNSLLDALIPALGGGGSVRAPVGPSGDGSAAAADEHLVSDRIKRNCEGGWPAVRRTLLATFGALEVGPEQAINRANAFYQSLVPAELLGVSGTLVHPDLQASLAAATGWLTAQPGLDIDAVRQQTGRPGGFNIRANRNNPVKLSEHSFGFAIDLKASLNPNIGRKGRALDAVADATGIDPFAARTAGASTGQVAAVAAGLHLASETYVRIMADAGAFSARVRSIVDAVRTAEGLAPLDDAAAAALSDLLRTEGKDVPGADRILAAAFPTAAVTPQRKPVLGSLTRLGRAWRAANPKSGKRPAARSEATVGSVAAHGFLNLPPAVVAALTGADAGGLTWLGTSGVHDFMHFELPPGKRPKLY